jgi:hypothetical protein
MKIHIILFFALGFILLTAIVAMGVPPPAFPNAPDQAPIDGGLTLLAAAGGMYAWKRLRAKSE